MIGIETKYESSYGKLIYELLKGIDFNDYKFEVVQQEIICSSKNDDILFSKISIGTEFINEINCDENYYVLEFNLRIYPLKSEIKEIENYSDYVNSECEFMLLISDNEYIEVYSKNNYLLNVIIENLKSKNINYIEKTLENDGRTKMYV